MENIGITHWQRTLSKSVKEKSLRSAKSEVKCLKPSLRKYQESTFIFPSVKFIENLAKEAQKPLIDTGIKCQ